MYRRAFRPAALAATLVLVLAGEIESRAEIQTAGLIESWKGSPTTSLIGSLTESRTESRTAGPIGSLTESWTESRTETPTGSAQCGPATIELTGPWRPAPDPEYVASFGDFTPDFAVEPDEQWKQLGEHRTDAILEVDTGVESRCDSDTCRTCVTTITARIGFTPSEIRLHEELRRNRCARRLVMVHERQHEAVTREAQALAMREAERNLRWAYHPHPAHVTPASALATGQEALTRKVGESLTRALETAMAHAEAENARLDRPERYRRESREHWSECGHRYGRAIRRSRCPEPSVPRGK